MSIIEAAKSEKDLSPFKGLRFERLLGKRGKERLRSLGLNNQWRLIVVIEEDNEGTSLMDG